VNILSSVYWCCLQALEDLCCAYDGTVRNSVGQVVQLNYGIDGLDPSAMEENGEAVDFNRVLHHVKVAAIIVRLVFLFVITIWYCKMCYCQCLFPWFIKSMMKHVNYIILYFYQL